MTSSQKAMCYVNSGPCLDTPQIKPPKNKENKHTIHALIKLTDTVTTAI